MAESGSVLRPGLQDYGGQVAHSALGILNYQVKSLSFFQYILNRMTMDRIWPSLDNLYYLLELIGLEVNYKIRDWELGIRYWVLANRQSQTPTRGLALFSKQHKQ
jgi:hypothetical protein